MAILSLQDWLKQPENQWAITSPAQVMYYNNYATAAAAKEKAEGLIAQNSTQPQPQIPTPTPTSAPVTTPTVIPALTPTTSSSSPDDSTAYWWDDAQITGKVVPAKPAYTVPVGGASFADVIGPSVPTASTTSPPPTTTPPPSTGGYTPPPAVTNPWTQPVVGNGSLQPVSQMSATPYLNMLQPAIRAATNRGVPTSNIYGAQLNAKNPSGYQTYLNTFDAIMNAPKQMPSYQFTPAPTAAQSAAMSAAGGVQPGLPPSQSDTGSYGQWVYG